LFYGVFIERAGQMGQRKVQETEVTSIVGTISIMLLIMKKSRC